MLLLLHRAVESGEHIIERSKIQLKAPVTNPQKVIGIGLNYADHCAEKNVPVPKFPVVVSKYPNAIQDPYGPIIYPTESTVSF